MEFDLKYGRDKMRFHIPAKNLKAVIQRENRSSSETPESIIANALEHPIGS
ncbi:MAG: lactate racemase domain-containing protein, partial [Ignavibacteriales bacterium]